MYDQFQQLITTYKSLNGIRGMADLVNNPGLRHYLPDDYKQILDGGYGDWQQIQAAYKLYDMAKSHKTCGLRRKKGQRWCDSGYQSDRTGQKHSRLFQQELNTTEFQFLQKEYQNENEIFNSALDLV